MTNCPLVIPEEIVLKESKIDQELPLSNRPLMAAPLYIQTEVISEDDIEEKPKLNSISLFSESFDSQKRTPAR